MKRGSKKNRFLDRRLGVPLLIATALLARRRQMPERITRIGVMVSPTVGDTLINSAAVQDIKNHYPQSQLLYFASGGAIAAAKLLPCIDEIVPLQITNPFQTLRSLRAARLDLLLDFTPWQRLTAFYSALSGARCRVGFRSINQHRHFHYDIVAEHSNQVHELENFRRLLRTAGIIPSSSPRVSLASDSCLAYKDASTLIVFHPWAAGDRALLRQWPLDSWLKLALSLHQPGDLFAVTGSSADLKNSEELCRLLQDSGLNAIVHKSADGLAELAAMLRDSDLVVSVNTGILHLAAIAGAPTVALNGPTATHRWGPVGPNVISVEPYDGSGGFLHFGFEFDGNPTNTMERIRVEDVVIAAHHVMHPARPIAHTA